MFKTTEYFRYRRKRADRLRIRDEWIETAIDHPIREVVQADGRIRRWAYIDLERRFLRVVLLADAITVHNAFFDRGFLKMKVTYFKDTDTAVVELIDAPVEETRELNENVYLDLDAHGNLVSLTIEHARERANLPEMLFSQGG